MEFSIVVNTLDREQHLKTLLQALRYQRYKNFEVIVVNGPSKDGTEDLLSEWADTIKIKDCPVANLSVSRNIGIHASAGDIIAFIDDDAIPEPNWLDELSTYYVDPRIGAVGGYIRDNTGIAFQCKVTVCDLHGNGHQFINLEEAFKFISENNNHRFLSQTGANSSFRREALLEIGGFDEEFAYFLEETDVNYRIQQAGYKLVYSPNAEVHHKYAPSAIRDEQKVPKSLYRPTRSKAYFCMKYARDPSAIYEALSHLTIYAQDIRRHNKWYYQNNIIDISQYKLLNEDLDRGIMDGIRKAYAQGSPSLLKVAKTTNASYAIFKPFSGLLNHDKRLRICFLSREYPPLTCGGIGKWTHEISSGLAEMGHEVTVVTASSNGNATVDFEGGVWVHRIVATWQPDRNDPPLPDIPQVLKDYAYSAFDEITRIRLVRGLDIVSAPIWDLEGIACVASNSIPTVTSLHTTFKLCKPHKPEWNLNDEYENHHVNKAIKGEEFLLQQSEFILANSNAVKSDVQNAYPEIAIGEKTRLIPHGLREVITHTTSNNNTHIDILFVGRLEQRKGADLLLKVAPKILEEHCHVRFHLVGNDTIRVGNSTLRELFEKNNSGKDWFSRILFYGTVDMNELHKHYASCDIFVAPSRYESFGLVYLEAMMFSKPCIGTKIGGIPEVIINNETGLLCEPGDANSLASSIRNLINNEELRCSLGEQGRIRYEEYFTQRVMCEELIDTYSTWINS